MFYSKKLTLFLLIVFFFVATFYPISAAAQISSLYSYTYSYSGIKPFGGRIISMQPCQKPAGMMLNISGPRGGQFLLTDSSKIFNYGVFNPGIWTLGTADASTVTCKGKSGLFSGGMIFAGASAALAGAEIFQGGLGALGSGKFLTAGLIPGLEFNLPFSYVQIGLMAAFIATKFIFRKKLDTLGHPHVIQIVGTSF